MPLFPNSSNGNESLIGFDGNRDFIEKGIMSGIRGDGRSPLDQRPYILETGIVTQASGSCRVCVDEQTDVLVGVKAQVGDVNTGSNAVESTEESEGNNGLNGRIECSVECSKSAILSSVDQFQTSQMCNEYSQTLNRLLNGSHGGVDLQKLCIVPGSTCWVLNVDILILDDGGNLLDVIMMAIRGALFNTRLPKCVVEQVDGRWAFEIGDEETEPLTGVENVPFAVTLHKIAQCFVVDATPLEQLASECRVAFFLNSNANVCGIQKSGSGAVDSGILLQMIETGSTISSTLFPRFDKLLRTEEKKRLTHQEPIGYRSRG